MSLFIAGIFIGVLGAFLGLVVYDKFAEKLPPTASRWVIRGREVEVYLHRNSCGWAGGLYALARGA